MMLDLGCSWRKHGDIGVDYTRIVYGRRSVLDIQSDAEHLPFKDNAFDKVISCKVFDRHVLTTFNFLKGLRRVVKPNGLIEIVNDNPYHCAWTVLKCGMGGTEQSDLAPDHHAIHYPENIRRLFRKLGIADVAFRWEEKQPWIITYPFANLLVKIGIWRKECLYLRYKIIGEKTVCAS